jgi:hypothetical protein
VASLISEKLADPLFKVLTNHNFFSSAGDNGLADAIAMAN